jgi:hypothetical protein
VVPLNYSFKATMMVNCGVLLLRLRMSINSLPQEVASILFYLRLKCLAYTIFRFQKVIRQLDSGMRKSIE